VVRDSSGNSSNRERERERGKSSRGARKKKGVREIETLNKPYGFGSFNNRSHIPLFGTGSCWTEAKHPTASSLFQKCSPFLASGLVGPRHILLFIWSDSCICRLLHMLSLYVIISQLDKIRLRNNTWLSQSWLSKEYFDKSWLICEKCTQEVSQEWLEA